MGNVQHIWCRRCTDFPADAFFSPRNSPSFFSLHGWQLLGGVLGPVYVVILTVATPVIGIAMTMIGILAGQVFKSLIIDHFGLLGTPRGK